MYFDRGNFYDFTSLGEFASAFASAIIWNSFNFILIHFLDNTPIFLLI